jgi:hypothetical protein
VDGVHQGATLLGACLVTGRIVGRRVRAGRPILIEIITSCPRKVITLSFGLHFVLFSKSTASPSNSVKDFVTNVAAFVSARNGLHRNLTHNCLATKICER